MNTKNVRDMKARPPHRSDVLVNAVFGDQSPGLFREGKYYEKGNIAYTYDQNTGDIDVWECQKSGIYGRPAQPSWVPWSMEEVRARLSALEDFIGNNEDTYDIRSYDHSYLIHDVGVRDWVFRGSFIEVFNDKKYLPKKYYKIEGEEIVPSSEDVPLPKEWDTTLYLNKAKNTVPNLIRRIEMYGQVGKDGRIKIPFPIADMTLFSSYIFDLFIDGLYISQDFIKIDRESDEDKYVVVDFSAVKTPEKYDQAIEDEKLKVIYPIEEITMDSEVVFVFYISICHDLKLIKRDFNKFIGEEKERKWIDIMPLDFEERYQEIAIYNNGARMESKEYVFSGDRINVDDPQYRFAIGSFATVSMKTYQIAEQDVVPNVKQETVPIFENNTKILAIPFLNFDNSQDRFLVFNDGGILLGNQKWFEDHGFVNVYDDDAGLTPNDMVEFRMISRDKNMEIRVYTISTIMDNQKTYELPIRLKDVYFHMLFTENGEFISRSKYAVSGNLMQFRDQYATMLEGDRFELLCFVYVGDYGFTAMTNYRSNWNPSYATKEINTLPEVEEEQPDNPGTEEPTAPGGDDEPYTPAFPDYELVTNPLGTTLQYNPPEPPGTKYTLVQDTATNTLKSAITQYKVTYVLGVDCDNQIICTTVLGDIIRFDRDGEEDTRFALKEVAENTIDMMDSDDFGNTYYHEYSDLNVGKIGKVNPAGEKIWEFDGETSEEPFGYVRSMKYIDGYLYVQYAPYAITEYTIGKFNAMTGEFSVVPIVNPDSEDSVEPIQQWCARISHINRDHIFIGSNGHVIYEFEKNGLFVQKYTDMVEDFTAGNVMDICCDGKDGNVYAIVKNPMDYSYQLIKYNNEGELLYVKQYPGLLQMTTDASGYLYLFDSVGGSITENPNISKIDKDADGSIIWTYEFKTGITNLNSFFVDPVDYHVYGYYVNNNDYDIYRYIELEQNGLPLPKYRHEIVFNCDENVTTTDLIGSTVREIQALSAPTNRLYIGTDDGSIYTYTQGMREMSKGRTVKLWEEDNPDIPKYIIPDDEYNFYVIKDNIIEKWNRYERMKWRFDGNGIMLSVMRQIALNPETKDLVFLYQDTDGRHSLGKLSPDGEFEALQVTLPNGVKVEDADCSINCSTRGDYYFGYTGATVYRYSENFNYIATYGTNTAELLDGPVGNAIIDYDSRYLYVTVKNNGDERNDRLIKYNSAGEKVWEHDFFNGSLYGHLLIDENNDVYVCDEREIRKVDEYGNYVWRFRYKHEGLNTMVGKEPNHIVMDEFFRLFFVDDLGNLHRIDQYDLTLDPIPDEPYEAPEPTDPINPPDEPDKPDHYILVQRRFDIPFEFNRATSAMLIFTNTGQYVGKRFYDIYDDQIVLKGSPIYEDGWLDIILIENVKESIIL